MTSDWPLLALIGSAATGIGTAAATGATGLASTVGGALGGLGSAAGGALKALGAGAGPAASTAAAPAATEAAPAAASAVSTSNLPAAVGGTQLAAPAAPSAAGGAGGGGGGFLDNLLGRGPSSQIGVSTPGGPMAVPPGAENLSQAVPYQGSLPGTSFLGQLGAGAKQMALGRLGVTNPNMGFLDMLKQGGLSQVSGGPFVGYNPQSSFLSNLGGAVRQRVFSQLSPSPGGGQSPQDIQRIVQMLLAQQGQPARQLPVYGSLPGYG